MKRKEIIQSITYARERDRQPNLRGAYLAGVNLEQVNLRDVNLQGAYLRRADLTGANLSQANLNGVKYNHATMWPPDVDPMHAGAIYKE